MVTGRRGRLFLSVVVVMGVLVALSGNSFAAEKVKASELSRALAQAKLFAGLTDNERAALKSMAALRYGREGERIIEQGKPLDRMFIVLKGKAEVRLNGPEHRGNIGCPPYCVLEPTSRPPYGTDYRKI